ncbi:hypothetical protein F6455_03115 [Proteobacteria bacterium 005FR1]|nr:hypothetical protein [Proteobacteria bacterium 005FR1]
MEGRAHLGVVGLGGLGGALATQALRKGMHVVGYEPAGASEELQESGIDLLTMPGQFRQRLESPRRILLQVPVAAVERLLAQLTPVLEAGDVVIDASDSHWVDSVRRQEEALAQGLNLVDCGIAGGIRGARTGACFMIGGESGSIALVEPALRLLAAPGSFVNCGPPGSGHFAKAIHDAIQSALIQALGEGVQLLESWPHHLPVTTIIRAWVEGATIRSWPLTLLAETIGDGRESGARGKSAFSGADSCKLLEEAAHRRLAVPVLAQAAMQALVSDSGGFGSDRIAKLIIGAMNTAVAEQEEAALRPDQTAPWLAREAPKGGGETKGNRPD